MNKKVLLILALLVLGSFGVASADPADDAIAHVYLDVDPNIAVNATLASFDLGSVQTGDRPGTVIFRIDANTQQIRLYIEVSNLYKGDDCANMDVAPIPVNVVAGVGVQAASANPIGGHPNNLALNGGPTILNTCFNAYRSETVVFESSQNNHFSQEVQFTPIWTQSDPEKPMGQYSGFVRLTTMVQLPGAPV